MMYHTHSLRGTLLLLSLFFHHFFHAVNQMKSLSMLAMSDYVINLSACESLISTNKTWFSFFFYEESLLLLAWIDAASTAMKTLHESVEFFLVVELKLSHKLTQQHTSTAMFDGKRPQNSLRFFR